METDRIKSEAKLKLEKEISDLEEQLETILDTIKLISEEFERIADETEESKERLTQVLYEEMREFEIVQATLKKKKSEHLMTMGFFERSLENNLKELKVHSEVYFGQDCYVGNSMHKIYKNFRNGESKLIDMFLCYPELHQKLKNYLLL